MFCFRRPQNEDKNVSLFGVLTLQCAGAAIFALGLWIRFDEYMMDYVKGLGMYHYWVGTSTVMAGSALVMITAFLGCCGAFFRSVPMVLTVR